MEAHKIKTKIIMAKYFKKKLENDLKQGLTPPMGMELATSLMLEVSSHKFS